MKMIIPLVEDDMILFLMEDAMPIPLDTGRNIPAATTGGGCSGGQFEEKRSYLRGYLV